MTKNLGKKVLSGLIVLYSVAVMAGSTPTFGDISNIPVIIYFMFLPGLAFSLLLRETYGILERLSISVIFSLGAVLTLLAVKEMVYPTNFPLPYEVIIPVITILATSYYYFSRSLVARPQS